MKSIPDIELENKIVSLVEDGNMHHDKKNFAQALVKYTEAWASLPEVKTEWEISGWVASCIYSAYFDMSDYESAKQWAKISLQTRSSEIDTAPLIDLGMVCYELGELDEAYSYFNDAYEYGKKRAFQERPKKYIDFYLGVKKTTH